MLADFEWRLDCGFCERSKMPFCSDLALVKQLANSCLFQNRPEIGGPLMVRDRVEVTLG